MEADMRRTTLSLVAFNLGFLIALLAGPAAVSGQVEEKPPVYQPCCKKGTQGNYCCTDCCSKMDCASSKICNPKPKGEEEI
jgi:hypothetical protein